MSRWTEADLRNRPGIKGVISPPALPWEKMPLAKKPSKMGNLPTIVDGFKFQSRLEAEYYRKLVLEWKAGSVLWFTRQVPFWLEGGVKYIADFLIVRPTGVKVIDTTGRLTRTKINKLKQMLDRYGILVEVVYEDGRVWSVDDIGTVPRGTFEVRAK